MTRGHSAICETKSTVILLTNQGRPLVSRTSSFVTAFESHLTAAVCEELQIESPDDDFPFEDKREWLESLAQSIVRNHIMPCDTLSDPILAMHRSFLYCAFLYIDLRQAIRDEEGDQIVRHWKHWLILFLATNRKNYATEALNLLINLSSIFPRHIAHIATHNRTVNTKGTQGHGKPIDQMLEHYNL